MTRTQQKIILEMYRAEAPFSAIAAAINMSENTVKDWVRRHRDKFGLPRRRNMADKVGSLSVTTEETSTWNLVRGLELIKRKWT